MEIRTPADRLWFVTTRLECRGSKGTSVGTGFFYAVYVREPGTGEAVPIPFMVTNRHVAEAAEDVLLIYMVQGAADESGKIRKPILGQEANVKLKNPLPETSFHPDPEIDVAILPFYKYVEQFSEMGRGMPMIATVGPQEMLAESVADGLDSWEQVIVVGYPEGLFDAHNLTPIVRSGYTASPIRLDYQGRSTFLIDAPI